MKPANKCSRDVVRFPTHLLLEVTSRYMSVEEPDYRGIAGFIAFINDSLFK